MRDSRDRNSLREIKVTNNFMRNSLGSCLIEHGNTKVICSATVENRVPRWLRGKGHGWITAEYSMLPTSTNERTEREVNRGKLSGRTQEIQRLIGRSLRSICNLSILTEKIIKIDCDVLSADGGTRTASINGAWIALRLALKEMINKKIISGNFILSGLSAISCGLLNNNVMLDLNYEEDSNAEADANFVFDSNGNIVEIQCTGEKASISSAKFSEMFKLAKDSCEKIYEIQKNCIK